MPLAKLVVVGDDFLVVAFDGIARAFEKLVTVIGIPSEIWQLGGILGG